MGTINFRKMDAAAAELAEEAKRLRSVQIHLEELSTKQSTENLRDSQEPAQKDVSDNDSMEMENSSGAKSSGNYSLSGLEAETIAEMLFVEADALEKASAVLREAVRMYRQAEERVLAVYDGELLVVPRTVFGTSYFENLRDYAPYIPIRQDSLSGSGVGCDSTVTGTGGQAETETGDDQEMRSLEGIL